jgi:protein ImuA
MDLSAFPTAGALALGGSAPRWRPGLPCTPHSELFADSREASGAALALALALDGLSGQRPKQNSEPELIHAGESDLADRRQVLWVQDAAAIRLSGRPYRPGLPESLRRRLIHVRASRPEDALFALEEGVRCRELAWIIGEIAGNPRALDFTASRRLSLAAEKHGVPLFLVRLDARRDLSAARMRWQVAAAPSLPLRWNPAAPGAPSWHAELFRARTHAPGEWTLRDDGQVLAAERRASSSDHGDLAGAAGDRSLAAS